MNEDRRNLPQFERCADCGKLHVFGSADRCPCKNPDGVTVDALKKNKEMK